MTRSTEVLLLFTVFVFVAGVNVSNYSRLCKMHTMDIYQGFGRKCKSWLHLGVEHAEEINKIVELHNYYRRKVALGMEKRGLPGPQPKAANMQKLTWDSELATISQRWAQQCIFGHDECRNVARFGWVGQNIYLSSQWKAKGSAPDDKQNWDQAVAAFYDEVRYLNKMKVSSFKCCPSKNKTGHYTQLVWGNSKHVGCGFISYMDETWHQKYYVCNYAPGGNILEDTVYKIGPACSGCPKGSRCEENLCA